MLMAVPVTVTRKIKYPDGLRFGHGFCTGVHKGIMFLAPKYFPQQISKLWERLNN
jgi:hypothetical protein